LGNLDKSSLLKKLQIQLNQDWKRFQNIIMIAKDIKDEYKGSQDDLYRMFIVFLHATLETLLREILRFIFINNPKYILNDISIISKSSKRYPHKITLSELYEHKDMTVDQLIKLSINQFLDKMSFNSYREIINQLQKAQLKTKILTKYQDNIDAMISKRHQIVHRFDRTNSKDEKPIESLNYKVIGQWMYNTAMFCNDVIQLFDPGSDIAEVNKESMKFFQRLIT